ncbi:MAG: outer membrane beta-barrel protein [Chitinophagaceae bacterium]
MQNVEDNMEELFRKAADNYMPKNGESHWNEIVSKLPENAVAEKTSKNNYVKKSSLLIFLFLFLMIGGIFIIANKYNSENLESGKTFLAEIYKNNSAYNSNKQSAELHKIQDENNSITKINSAHSSTAKNKKSLVAQSNTFNKSNVFLAPTFQEKTNGNFEIEKISKNYEADHLNSSNVSLKNITSLQKNENINEEKNPTNKSDVFQKQRRFYYGLIAGIQMNEVKNQGMKKPGFDFGIIAGYSFNKRTSIETGLLFSKKYYFTDGKYFSTDKMGSSMPAGMKILNLDGSSKVFEIPVKLKYNVINKTNKNIFSSAGITSYVMTGEKNNYLTSLNGFRNTMNGSYRNVSKYFAAAVTVSAGYENKIGKSTNIRVEPYLQIPLKGFGIGSLPVTTAGLHIGITKFSH